jgi:hypothetical protein
MKKKILSLTAALLFVLTVPFFTAAQTTEEVTGRFGAEEPVPAVSVDGDKPTYSNRRLFLGGRLGPSLRFYTPEGDTAFTGGDTNAVSLDAAVQVNLLIVPLFSVQAEAVFTWDNASVWQYARNPNGVDLDRYTRWFRGFSLQFPLTARLNFYPGKFRLSPFLGGYVLLPLGNMKTGSALDGELSFSRPIPSSLGLLGGLSAAYPFGSGILFVDVRFAADLSEQELRDSGLKTFRRNALSISLGYEFGFFKKQ